MFPTALLLQSRQCPSTSLACMSATVLCSRKMCLTSHLNDDGATFRMSRSTQTIECTTTVPARADLCVANTQSGEAGREKRDKVRTRVSLRLSDTRWNSADVDFFAFSSKAAGEETFESFCRFSAICGPATLSVIFPGCIPSSSSSKEVLKQIPQ